jgi:hypothetical protein
MRKFFKKIGFKIEFTKITESTPDGKFIFLLKILKDKLKEPKRPRQG